MGALRIREGVVLGYGGRVCAWRKLRGRLTSGVGHGEHGVHCERADFDPDDSQRRLHHADIKDPEFLPLVFPEHDHAPGSAHR